MPFLLDIIDPTDNITTGDTQTADADDGTPVGLTAASVMQLRQRRSDGRLPAEVADAAGELERSPGFSSAAQVQRYRENHGGYVPGEGGSR